ncbi:MAG: hypothetical protein ACOCPX_05005 [Halapricum sp.]
MDPADLSERDIDSTFEALETATAGEPLFRGTHHYEHATVERTYYLQDGLLNVEAVYIDHGSELATVSESWLLEDGRLGHTGQPVAQFCRSHHFEEPATDIRFCLDTDETATAEALSDPDVTSTFQPARTVTVEDGAALRYEGVHTADAARVERSFFVSDSEECIRVRTTYFWDDERLGSLEQRRDLLDDGEFVAVTGEPIEAFCRRTHLVDPEADVRYCARLGSESGSADTSGSRD